MRRPWHPFTEPHLVIDNVGDLDVHTEAVLGWLASRSDHGSA